MLQPHLTAMPAACSAPNKTSANTSASVAYLDNIRMKEREGGGVGAAYWATSAGGHATENAE